jgi:hypothetical protein
MAGVHEATHVWGDKYQVATTLDRAQVSALPGVSSVVRNNLLSLSSTPATNDPDLADEYYIDNYGQVIDGRAGKPGASANFSYAWARSRGNGVVVADIDTGVDLKNPDLAGQPRPPAKNFRAAPPDNDVPAPTTRPGSYPGTTVDGVLAAAAGNGVEGAGGAPEARILALKCSDSEVLSDSCIYAAGEYAISQHVKIINMSFGEQASSDPTLQSLVADAQKAGILITASAGNSGTDNDTTPVLPAGFSTTYNNVIAVGATNNQDHLASYSDYGATTVDLMAPGSSIFTDYPTYTGYQTAYASGTSYSAPLVAATAALLWSLAPHLSYLQVKSAILQSAQKIPSLSHLCVSGGRLDAQAAVALVRQRVQWSFTGFDEIQPQQAANVSIAVSAQKGTLPSGVPLGYHLALVYNYLGTMYYVTKQDLTWSIGGSSPKVQRTGADGSVFIAPPGTDSTNYGASPLDISLANPGLSPGYYGLVAYAATKQAPGAPIGNQQAVFFEVGSLPVPSPGSTTTGPAAATTTSSTTTSSTTTTTNGADGTTTTAAGTTSTTLAGTVTTTAAGTTTTSVTTAPTTTTTAAAVTTTTGATTTTSASTTTTSAGTTSTTLAGTTTTSGNGTTTAPSGASFSLTYVSPDQLPTSGGEVQVFGNNLPANPIVYVGDQGEPVSTSSSTEIDVTVPATLAGTYSVTVYNSTKSQSAALPRALTIGSGTAATTTPAGGTTTSTTTTTAGTTTTTATTTAGTTTTGPGGPLGETGGAVLAPVPSGSLISTVNVGEWPAFSAAQIIFDSGGSPGSAVPGVDV